MAKDKKNGKKKIRTSKQPVSMILIQNQLPGAVLSENDKERFYQNFRNRAKTKSEHAYVDCSEDPQLLRLYLLGTLFNSTAEYLVEFGSFHPIMGGTNGTRETEVGFEVNLKNLMTPGKTHKLRVIRKKHKATLYISL